jgi:hypothetical protein
LLFVLRVTGLRVRKMDFRTLKKLKGTQECDEKGCGGEKLKKCRLGILAWTVADYVEK